MEYNIFISYARESKQVAKEIYDCLKLSNYTVWWDNNLQAGEDFAREIESVISRAEHVLVIWSKESVVSDWVRAEAKIGYEQKKLITITIDPDLQIPPPYNLLHNLDFSSWNRESSSREIQKLLYAMEDKPYKPESKPPESEPSNNWFKKIRFSFRENKFKFWKSVRNYLLPLSISIAVGALLFNYFLAKSNTTGIEQDPIMSDNGFIFLEGADFLFGSTSIHAGAEEQPASPQTVDNFWIGQHEVTFDEFDQFTQAHSQPLTDDYGWGRGSRPVNAISWAKAMKFAEWQGQRISEKSEYTYKCRLPTEVEWEFAAKGGGEHDWYWDETGARSELYAWHDINTDNKTEPVGQLLPNEYGLYDVSGNLIEWTLSCHTSSLLNYSDSTVVSRNCKKVARGGSFFNSISTIRHTSRTEDEAYEPGRESYEIGFRVACQRIR